MSDPRQRDSDSHALTRRTLLQAAGLVGAGLVAGRPLPASAQDAPMTLDFPSWQAEEPGFAEWWGGLIEAFQAEHPNVTINLTQVPFAQYVDTMVTRFAANDPPQIVHLPSANFPQFANQGWLAPIGPCLQEAGVVTGDGAPDQWISLQQEMTWNGEVQGLLLLGYGFALYYNQQMLDDAGVAVPTTAEELIAAAEAMTSDGVFGMAGVTAEHPGIYSEASTFVLGNELAWVKDGQYALTDPEVIAAIDNFRALYEFAPPGNNSSQARQLFFDGKAAMLTDGPWVLALRDEAVEEVAAQVKVAQIPFPHHVGGVSNGLHIPTGLSEEETALVCAFLQLAAQPEWQDQYAALTKSPAPRKDAVTAETLEANPELAVFSEAAVDATSLFPDSQTVKENYSEFQKIVISGLMQLITTDTPTSEVLQGVQDELNDVLPLEG